MKTRVLVCGGHNYSDLATVRDVLDRLESIDVLIVGDAPGADNIAARWADLNAVPRLTFKADWERHGRAAGPIRNQRMLNEGKPTIVVAFPGGRGTEDMVLRARKASIPVLVVPQ